MYKTDLIAGFVVGFDFMCSVVNKYLSYYFKEEENRQVIIKKVNSYEEMSIEAANVFKEQLQKKQNSVLGLATGSTPLGLYEQLRLMNHKGEIDFAKVKTANLDEYAGLAPDHVQSYRYFMDENLFNHINIEKKNTHVPDGMAKDPKIECERYEALIEEMGGIDLQLLGVGYNGHIGFNEPAEVFCRDTNYVKLTENTIEANSRLFDDISEVPKYAFTMGIRTIMLAKQIILLANADKETILTEAAYGPINPRIPVSILQVHPNATVIINTAN